MTDQPNDQMSVETRALLGELTREDIDTIRRGIPIIRAIIGFGKVTKWIAIFVVGILAGGVLLGESVMKLVSWFWPPSHP